jgi:PAS domain S-box-containing protein
VIIAGAPNGKILRVSNYVSQMLGHPRTDLEGKTLDEVLVLLPGYDETGRRLATSERSLHIALQGATVTGQEIWVDAADGERIPVMSSAAPIRNWRGEVIGAISSIADLRSHKALEQSLREAVVQRESLYRELAHRVKNHLQLMSALVSLEARDPKLSAKGLANLIKGRFQTLAAVYRGMDETEAADRIGARSFFEAVSRPYASDGVSVEAAVAPDLTLASDQAAPVGMLVDEAAQRHLDVAASSPAACAWRPPRSACWWTRRSATARSTPSTDAAATSRCRCAASSPAACAWRSPTTGPDGAPSIRPSPPMVWI